MFVPVLLGTGMILSAVAWLVERAAGLVACRTVDPRAAATVPLHLPLGSVSSDPPAVAGASAEREPRLRWPLAFLVAVMIGTAAVGVEAVRRLTQSTVDAPVRTGSTELVVAVRSPDERTPVEMAVALWTVCRERLDQWPVATVEAVRDDEVTLRLDQALSETARRRMVGCVEDFTLERVLGTVVRLTIDDGDEDDRVADHEGTAAA